MKILESGIEWNYPLTPLNLNNIQYIVVHHIAAVEATPLQVDAWDKANGWNGAGYNYYVRKDGTVYEMRGDNIGSQCLNYNSISYGIGCEGDYEHYDTEMPKEQYKSLLEVVKWLKGRFPQAQIVGHKELFATACPGQYFPLDDIKNLKEPEIQLPEATKSINILAGHSIIGDTSYWIQNVWDGGSIEGEYMATIIKRFVACYKILNTYYEVIDELVSMGIIGDKSYWLENAKEGRTVEGKYAEIVINRMANYILGGKVA